MVLTPARWLRLAPEVLEALPLAVVAVERDGSLAFANSAARDLVEWIGDEHGDPDDVDVALQRLGVALRREVGEDAGDRARLTTVGVPTRAGLAHRDVLVRRLEDDDDGGDLVIAAFVGALAAPADAASEQAARLEAMLAHTTDIITVLDNTGAIQYSNAASGRLTGLAGTSVSGTSAFDFVHPDDQDFAAATFLDCLRRPGSSSPFELRIKYADGEWHDVEAVVNNLLGVPGVDGIVVTIHDVTDRKRGQEQLRRSEDWHRSVIENLTDVIVVLDDAFEVAYVSPAIERLIGAPAHTNIGMSALNDIHPDDVAAVRAVLAEVAAAPLGHTTSVELRLEFRPGSDEWAWLHATVVNRLDDPSVRGIVCTLRNVTAERGALESLEAAYQREREAAERLRELDKLKDEFLSTVSHELRTPLTSITGFARVLQRGEADAGMAATMLGRIAANAEEMAHMVEQLLDFSRLQAGRVSVQMRPVEVATAVRRSVDWLAHQLADRSVTVDVDASLTALADEDALGHVLRNLLTNAAKYSHPGAAIRVSASVDQDEVAVAVADEGIGIPPELHELVFERFYRGPDVQTGRRGTGVGLSVVRRYVELMGGRTWVESEVGLGSTFSFSLPKG
jgi:PAS domain S-box-containing protein